MRTRSWVAAALLGVLSTACRDATGTPAGPAATLQAAAGDGQSAEAGTALAQPLTLRVVDANGRPVAGETVSWSTDPLGGTLQPAESATDRNGYASTRWTLGDAGEWTATARAAGLGPVTFHASAGGPLMLRVLSPAPGDTVDSVPVRILLHAEQGWTRLEASAAGRSVPLTLEGERFEGSVFAARLPISAAEGEQRVVISSVDARGHRSAGVVTVFHDAPPTLRVQSPATAIDEGSAALVGRVPLKATCADDAGGCRSIEVFLRGTLVARGSGSLDTTVEVSGQPGTGRLDFVATGAHGLHATVTSPEYALLPAPGWSTVTVAPGPIVTAGVDRLLYQLPKSAGIFLWDPATRTTLRGISGYYGDPAAVTPDGAVFITVMGLVQWGGNETRGANPTWLQASGPWVFWREGPGVLHRENVLTRTTERVDLSPLAPTSGALAPDGTVAFAADRIYLWRPGQAPERTAFDGTAVFGIANDGVNVVWLRDGVWMLHDGVATRIATDAWDSAEHLRARDGWIAWQGAKTYVRAPDGTVYTVTGLSATYVSLGMLGPGGQLLTYGSLRELSSVPYTAPVKLPVGYDGKAFWIGETLYAVTGNTLVRRDR